MNRKQKIRNLLTNKLDGFTLEIVDNSYLHVGHNNFDGNDETHIKILLTKTNTKVINRLEIHRKINELLKNEYNHGLHSLEIEIN